MGKRSAEVAMPKACLSMLRREEPLYTPDIRFQSTTKEPLAAVVVAAGSAQRPLSFSRSKLAAVVVLAIRRGLAPAALSRMARTARRLPVDWAARRELLMPAATEVA